MSQTFVIDTNILEIAQDYKNTSCLSAAKLIYTIYNNCNKIAYNEKIQKEYLRHIHERFIQNWYNSNHIMNKFKYIHSSSLGKDLLKKLNDFDPDDIKYIEVANSCPNKVIITENSDFNDEIKSVLEELLDIEVWCIEEALQNIIS